MSRFANVMKGKRARKSFEFPATALDPEVSAEDRLVDFVVLSGDEEAAAIEGARDFAKKHGADDPKQGDPHFDLGLMVHTLVRACVDHGVPGSFAFFFETEASKGDFRKMADGALKALDRETIVYLYQLQQVWQDECSPWGKGDTEDTILAKLIQLEGVLDPARPFELMRPATVGSLLLSTVKQLAILRAARLELGGFSDGSGSSTTTPSTKANEPS